VTSDTGANGVADPIRVPAVVGRTWRRFLELPTLVRAFIALTIVDVIVRAPGIVGLVLDHGVGALLGIALSFLPHDLLILLPAILVLRQADAIERTPLVVQGATVIALVEAFQGPAQDLAGWLASPVDRVAPWAIVSIAVAIAGAGGWIALGRGVRQFTSPDPDSFVQGLGNLAAAGIGLAVLLSILSLMIGPAIDVGSPNANELMTLVTFLWALQPLAWAYVVRILIRGVGDTRRPSSATAIAAFAGLLSAVLVLVTSILGLFANANVAIAQSILQSSALALGWLPISGAVSLVVVAFALGLADPFERFLLPDPESGPAPAGRVEGGPA
jgi:hypothetical protein